MEIDGGERMTDDAKEVTLWEMQEFVRGHGDDGSCPACKKGTMTFNVDPPGESYAMLSMNRQAPNPLGANVAWLLVMFCADCGHVRTFLRDKVISWLRSNHE